MRLFPSRLPAVFLLLSFFADQVICRNPSFKSWAPPGAHDPSERYTDLVAYQGFQGSTNVLHLEELVRVQAEASWTEDDPSLTSRGAGEINYSVIVVQWRTHPSNLFRDQERVRAFASDSEGGGYVGSVQFASPFPGDYDGAEPPFNVGHPKDADKRVRMVHATDLVDSGLELDPRQVSTNLTKICPHPHA